jgi:SAM-dependent methyltransferase
MKKKYEIDKVFYPGSYVHITPSLVFPDVTYADSFRNTFKFYENVAIFEYLKKNKEYLEEPIFRFYQQDYHKPFKELTEEFDLVISQYAGFVGQSVKRYLKKGGILVCNNSHGDASMASLDLDYELIAVYRRKTDEKFIISDKNLLDYLIPKRGVEPIKEQLIKTMKGIAYTKSPSGYIFRRVK